MTFQERYNRAFKDCYTLMQDNYPPTATDEFWDKYLKAANELARSYDNDPFVRGLILAISNELEAMQ